MYLAILFYFYSLIAMGADFLGLKSKNWLPEIYEKLNTIINTHAHSGKKIIFDLDGTILEGDIADATLAVLSEQALLNNIPGYLLKPHNFSDAKDILDYGARFKQEELKNPYNFEPNLSYYMWSTQILSSLNCQEIINASRHAYLHGSLSGLKPLVRPEIANLLAAFLHNNYEVWIISASPVLMVRYIALEVVNKLVAQEGVKNLLKADHIIGMTSLMRDSQGRLQSDHTLMRENSAYANLDLRTLSALTLTSTLTLPITGYKGKVEAIEKYVDSKKQIYFGAGDSLSDVPFLDICEHKLWVAQQKEAMNKTLDKSWLIQFSKI